jgi:hypothetical protein
VANLDPTVEQTATLPPGHHAHRPAGDQPWTISPWRCPSDPAAGLATTLTPERAVFEASCRDGGGGLGGADQATDRCGFRCSSPPYAAVRSGPRTPSDLRRERWWTSPNDSGSNS